MLILQGKVLAIKGVGGFHLACDARSDEVVALLRARKGRVDKPFAVMARDLAAIRDFARLSDAEADLLTSKERPIVLLEKKPNSTLSNLVSPGQQTVGVMLPYSPLHILLFQPLDDAAAPAPVLVMTSGNYSNEPIVIDNEVARGALASLADALLLHDREICSRCDDSVLCISDDEAKHVLPIRRSRGYAPFPIRLPQTMPAVLALGGELKATFCLTRGSEAYLGQHIGDMENLETLAAFAGAVQQFQSLFRVEPERIACDQHPGYLSRRWAEGRSLPVVAVQHHHAHIAALLAEHRHPGDRPVIGFSFDGTGYGSDGAIWGGELLLADYAGFERWSHLDYFPLAGGDAAVQRPYRLALAYLWSVGFPWDERLPAVQACPNTERRLLQRQLERDLNVVNTSSMGRLFDLVASLCGVRQKVTYEGQAAMELEALAQPEIVESYTFDRLASGRFSAKPVIEAIIADLLTGAATGVIAAKFHQAVANLILQQSLDCRRQTGLNQVALSGGVFQNRLLLRAATRGLQRQGFEIFTHRLTPPNDGGLALGQAVIAGLAND